MRKLNIVTPESRREAFLSQKYIDTLPLYQKGDDVTTDVSEADTTPYGQPIQVKSRPEYSKPSSVYDERRSVTFNPKNPSSRMLALEARAQVNNTVQPNIYMDKIEASTYADKSISALESKVKSLKSKSNE